MIEETYKNLVASGKLTAAQFQTRCAAYGITSEKYGNSWDDQCMSYEYANQLGPFAPTPSSQEIIVPPDLQPPPPPPPSRPKWLIPALIGGGLLVAGGITIAIVKR